MGSNTEEIIKEFVQGFIKKDFGSLIELIISEKVTKDKLNDTIQSLIEHQPDEQTKSILSEYAKELGKLIYNDIQNQNLYVLEEIRKCLTQELEACEISEDLRKPIVDNLEQYILKYIKENNRGYYNDIELLKKIEEIRASINPDSNPAGIIKGNQKLHIDSILDTNISKSIFREKEIQDIGKKLEKDETNLLFLIGQPGIGKTTLAKLYANNCEGKTLYFLRYRGSFEETLNELSSKKNGEGWKEVLKIWGELNDDQRRKILLIIDNFNDDNIKEGVSNYSKALKSNVFNRLKNLGIKILVTTRIKVETNSYEVSGVKDSVLLFRTYSRNELIDQNEIEELVKVSHNNTLILVLCAGLVREGKLLSKVLDGIKNCEVKNQKIQLEQQADFQSEEDRDYFTLYEQIKAILNMGKVLKEKINRDILANMTLLPLKGMQKREFLKFIHKDSDEGINDINNLIRRSWVIEEDQVLCLHPVIREVFLENEIIEWDRCEYYCSSLSEKMDLRLEFRDRERYKHYAEEVYRLLGNDQI